MSVLEVAALSVQPGASARQSAARTDTPVVEQTQAGQAVHYQPLVIVLAAVCAGIAVDRFFLFTLPNSFGLLWLVAAAALGVWLVFWKNERKRLAMAALLVAVAVAAACWHHSCWNLFGADELGLIATETSLFVAWYDYCRCACGKKTTPAMATGLAARVWTIKELLQGAA